MDTLVVRVTNASSTGVIYVLGQGDACRLETSPHKVLYQFDFALCGISWQLVLRIIIQKEKNYQTGADKKIPVLCVADTSDIVASNLLGADTVDSAGLNVTVRPSAGMKFFKAVSGVEVSGHEVKLSDRVFMTLKLDAEYQDDFDIKAKYCAAGSIVIIDNFCSIDPSLFPNFWRMRRGFLISEFGAFRETSLQGGVVTMNFTCVLELCKDYCNPSLCGDVYDGWGRKRRETKEAGSHLGYIITSGSSRDYQRSRKKRQSRRKDDDIDVGARIDIVDKYSRIKVITNDDFCWQISSFVFLNVGLGLCLLATSGGCMYLSFRISVYKNIIQNLKASMNGFSARDVLDLKRGHSIRGNKC
ncbi:uncharacterized protein LOC134267206 [Saccostrea cucullata]|uniref:uncharacterized protein LOC134267206 n=1 Tax=Saccostrea cuccullata TaxID=36930 RepID=UPI002ED09986